MNWEIEFTSAAFLPYLPESCQGNPGVYGFELADWLARSLAKKGIVTSYPIGEDWGWLIEHIDGEAETAIGCASLCDEGEGFAGGAVQWRIFVRPSGSLKGWFKRRSQDLDPSPLQAAIASVLTEAGYTFSAAASR